MSLHFNDQYPNNSNEELLIRAQVEDIYQIEEKINLINDQLNKSKTQNNFMKRIEELKLFRNNLLQKKIKLNEIFCSEIQKISNEIQEKFSFINNIENNIASLKNDLINYDTFSFQNMKLRKYILANSAQLSELGDGDNDSNLFLNEKEINDIILDNIDLSQDSEIIKLKRDIEINKASEKVIINSYNDINSKIAQIQENLKMLKEEKNTTKYELINLISCKESLESIIKLNINQLNIHNNQIKDKEKDEENEINNELKENEEIENNKWTKPNELYMYELEIIDSNKAAKSICNQIFNVFNIKGEDEDNIYNEINNNKKFNRFKKNKNKSNDFIINSYNTSEEFNYTNNKGIKHYKDSSFTDFNTINPSENIDIQNSIMSSYINNKNKKFSINRSLSNISSIFNKNIISSYIKDELDKYISGEINSYKTINEFLENLSIIIISKFQYANIIISAETLTIYLSYTFKVLYYDAIINAKIKFVNKDYKSIKKNYKKLIPVLFSELNKLDTKFQEYKSKTEIIKEQIKLLENNSKNIDVKKIKKIKLNKEEQNYLQICLKANSLNKQKNEIEKIISEYENKKEEVKQETDETLNKINEEINNIDNEIVQLDKEMKIEKNTLNNDINNYKQIIKEKYDIINEQLQIYKDKYGSNLDIYNKLINSINNTIKKSHIKSPLIIINNNNINNSNIFSYDQQIFNDDVSHISKIDNNINDFSSNNISIKNAKKINIPKKVFKTKSNKDFTKTNFETINKSKRFNNSKISDLSINNYDSKDKTNKTFYSMNISKKKLINKNKKNETYHNMSNILDNKTSYTNDRRYEKYNKYYNNYIHHDYIQKSLNLNLESNNNSNNHKYKSYSFMTAKNSTRRKKSGNNFNENITKKKLGLLSYKKDKVIYKKINLNNNLSHSNYNSAFLNKTDLNKLNNTLQGLKEVITQRNVIANNSNIFIEKINPLKKTIFCFYREYHIINNKKYKLLKYNPLINNSPEILCNYPYNFIPGKLFLDLNKDININVVPINKMRDNQENDTNIINIIEIENTIVNSKMKLIIEVHRDFRKYKESSKFKSLEDFVEKEEEKNRGLTKEEIIKCANNKNFNFLIAIKGGIIFELIICSYEEFKMWINGLAFLIKNKNEIIQYLE